MDDRDLDETLGNTSQNDIVLNDTWETESSEDEEEEEDDDQDEEDEDEDDDSFEESTDEEEIFGNHDDDEDIDLLKLLTDYNRKLLPGNPRNVKVDC